MYKCECWSIKEKQRHFTLPLRKLSTILARTRLRIRRMELRLCVIALSALLPLVLPAAADKNVKDFRVISWNSNGGRWDEVADLMKATYPSGGQQKQADLIAIQEAGSIRTLQNLKPLDGNSRATDFISGLPSLTEVSQQYEWKHQKTGQTLYLYYIELVETAGSKVTKQNLAIVSRARVNSVQIMKQEIPGNTNPSATYKYRPSIGVEIDGAYFFSVHPRPTDTRNEANELVDTILHEMAGNFRGKSWLVVGDFNREPTQLQIQANYEVKSRVGPPVYKAHQSIVATAVDKPTRAKRRLDYGVIGGPNNFDLTLNIQRLRDVKTLPHTSDHEPVLFNF